MSAELRKDLLFLALHQLQYMQSNSDKHLYNWQKVNESYNCKAYSLYQVEPFYYDNYKFCQINNGSEFKNESLLLKVYNLEFGFTYFTSFSTKSTPD